MGIIEDMISWRNEKGITLKQLALQSGISERLLETIEHGGVTHPEIAKRIVNAYGMSENRAYEIMPKIHRPDDKSYDPDAFKQQNGNFIIPPKIADITDIYIIERSESVKKKLFRKGRSPKMKGI